MAYTREQLEDMSSKKLVDIILTLQEERDSLANYKKIYNKIESILHPTQIDAVTDDAGVVIVKQKCGRKPLSPSEKAERYEQQKLRQKEQYWARKAQNNG